MIKILIAECNPEKNINLANSLSQKENFKIVYQSTTEKETYNHYVSNKPDVLLLNANIVSKNKNNLINQLQNNNQIHNKNNIIMYFDNEVHNFLGQMNNIYSIYASYNNIEQIEKDISNIYNQNKKPNCRELLMHILAQLGFNLSNYGTQFIVDATLHIYENKLSIYNIKDIYDILAAKHSTTQQRIKWNMEKSINSMCRYCKINIRSLFIDYDDERKLSPKYLISLLLTKLP